MPPGRLPAETISPPEWDMRDRFRKVRETTGLGQIEFAKLLEVPQATYAAYEAGRHRPRDPITFAKRLQFLTGVPATWILGLDEPGGVAAAPATASSDARDGDRPVTTLRRQAPNAEKCCLYSKPGQRLVVVADPPAAREAPGHPFAGRPAA
jgi:DNA-binding XRE family transcriptional regulator